MPQLPPSSRKDRVVPVIDINDLKNAIAEIVSARGTEAGFTVKQIVAKIAARKNIPVTELKAVEKNVRELLKAAEAHYGIVKSKDGRYFVTPKFFSKDVLSGAGSILYYYNPAVRTEDEVLAEILREDENLTLPQAIAHLIKLRDIINVDKVIEEIIEENPNPKSLLIDMLRFFVNLIDSLREIYLRESALETKNRIKNGIEKIINNIIIQVYGRVFGIPIRDRASYPAAPILIDYRDLRVIVDYDLLDRFLNRRILDDKFFVEEEFRDSAGKFVGIDSSVIELDIRKGPLSKYRQIPKLRIFTTVVASRGKAGEEIDQEFKPSPSEVAKSNMKRLEEERIVIPPSALLDFEPYYIPRIEEAVMQFREYTEIIDFLQRSSGVYIIYKDGALWPFERRLDDFIAVHRDYTIATLKKFYSVLTYISLEPPYIVGIVKRGHLGFLWYVVLYYILRDLQRRFGYKLTSENVLRLVSYIQQQESADGYLAYVMLLKYKLRKLGGADNLTVRTFAFVRKFYTTDDTLMKGLMNYCNLKNRPLLETENDIDAWKRIIWAILMQRDHRSYGSSFIEYLKTKDRNVLPEVEKNKIINILNGLGASHRASDFDLFVELYEKMVENGIEPSEYLSQSSQDVYHVLPLVASAGDTVIFYYLPPAYVEPQNLEDAINNGIQISLPRVEILLNAERAARAGVSRVLSVISAVILNPFVHYYVLYEENVERYLIVPVPVKDAHYAAKELLYKKVYPDYENTLLELLSMYLRTEA